MSKERILTKLVLATRIIFNSRNKTLAGSINDDTIYLHEMIDGEKVPVVIEQTEIPRVMVVGIADSLKIPLKMVKDLSALNLGDSNQQIEKNYAVLKHKYDLCVNTALSMNPEKAPKGMRRFVIKHNLITRNLNNQLGSNVIPDFPFKFKRALPND